MVDRINQDAKVLLPTQRVTAPTRASEETTVAPAVINVFDANDLNQVGPATFRANGAFDAGAVLAATRTTGQNVLVRPGPPRTPDENFRTGANAVNGVLMQIDGLFGLTDTLGPARATQDMNYRGVEGLMSSIWDAQTGGVSRKLTDGQLLGLLKTVDDLRADIEAFSGPPEGKTDDERNADQAKKDAAKEAFKKNVGPRITALQQALLGGPQRVAAGRTPEENFKTAAGLANGYLMQLGGLFDTEEVLADPTADQGLRAIQGLEKGIADAQGAQPPGRLTREATLALVRQLDDLNAEFAAATAIAPGVDPLEKDDDKISEQKAAQKKFQADVEVKKKALKARAASIVQQLGRLLNNGV